MTDTQKMNLEVKAKWLDALRSGEYEQCRSALHRTLGGFCCLGVLLDVTGEQWKPDRLNTRRFCPTTQESSSYLSDENLIRFGLSNKKQAHLTDMNDVYGNSFVEIADYVEANL